MVESSQAMSLVRRRLRLAGRARRRRRRGAERAARLGACCWLQGLQRMHCSWYIQLCLHTVNYTRLRGTGGGQRQRRWL